MRQRPVASEGRLPFGDGMRIKMAGCAASPAKRTLYVIGDSHATALDPMLRRVAARQGFNVDLMTKPGCSFLDAREPARPECRAFALTATAELLRGVRQGDMILLPSLRLHRFADQWAAFDEQQVIAASLGAAAERRRQAAEAEVDAWLQKVERAGARVVFTAPTPIFRAPAYRCSDWFNRGNPMCAPGLSMPRELLMRVRAPVVAGLERVAARHPGVSVWDSFDLLCPGATCRAVSQGRPMFIDGDHVSGYANTLLYPSFVSLLRELPTADGALRKNP